MKVVFCASEVFPFAKTGGLADVIGALPQALAERGVELTVFLPLYKDLNIENGRLVSVDKTLKRSRLSEHVEIYFVQNDKHFARDGYYGIDGKGFSDNLERFGFFSREICESLKKLNLKADIIHCHDWHTALIPLFLKEHYCADPFFSATRSILTIHNLAFQGDFPLEQAVLVGIDKKVIKKRKLEHYGKFNCLKSGIACSDRITTVSPRHAKEIQTKKFGCGLEGPLKSRKKSIAGILNGIDYRVWNPEGDSLIAQKYSSKNFAEAKAANKLTAQKKFGLACDKIVPLYGFVGRLSQQKGMDLLIESLPEMLKKEAQFVFLGVGEEKYEAALKTIARKFSKKLALKLEFDETLAHQIYAASDFFLMPSVFEPCGLSQMISMRYGTLPLVFKTGGLADTVIAYDNPKKTGNGFLFTTYQKKAFLAEYAKTLEVFNKPAILRRLIQNAFTADFSWNVSAKKYYEVYQCLLSD